MPLRLPLVLLPRAVPLLLLLLARTEARDACLQPFGPRSIWNLPLGSGAKLVPAKIRHRDERFPYLSVDPDVLVLSGTRCGGSAVAAPVTPVVQSKSGSSGFFQGGSTGRCAVAAGAAARPYFSAPIPKDFIIPDCTPRGSCGWPWDDSQNYAAALLDADQETVHQIQPFQRCTDDGPATAADPYPPVALHDDSLNSTFGAHGGSAFSSIGGTLRLGELTPARAPYGPRHALKIELEAFNYYYKPCFKFPGKTCDGYQMHQKVRVWAACVLLGCVLVAGCVLAVRSGRCQRKRESSESSNGLAAPINTAEASDDNDDGAHGSSVSPESVCCCCRPRCQRGMAYAGGAIWLMLAIVSATAVAFPSLSASYRGTNPALQMGSLLAVPPSASASQLGLETVPAKMLHWTMQNYGAYVVDTTGWNVYAICTEVSPRGDVVREFQAAWNFSMIPPGGKTHGAQGESDVPSTAWGRDIQRLVDALHVVDNWDAEVYERVAQSGGKLGVGGGAARQPWAEPLARMAAQG